MSESILPTFFKWGTCTSKDKDTPDAIAVAPLELETFETEYSINIRANVDGEEKIVPLQSLESNNKQLFQKWTSAVQSGQIKIGKKFLIKTWLGTSKNGRKIRRYELEF